jgi:hypothetical protein
MKIGKLKLDGKERLYRIMSERKRWMVSKE